MLMYDNNKKVEKQNTDKKYVYKTNENQAINKIRENLVKAVAAENKLEPNKFFTKIYNQLQKEIVPIRPNRICNNNRKPKHLFIKFSQNIKYYDNIVLS